MCPVDHDVSYVQSSRILHLTILKYGVSLYIFTLTEFPMEYMFYGICRRTDLDIMLI